MVTKEKLKKEIDKLPSNLMEEVYTFLKKIHSSKKETSKEIKLRDFKGKFDQTDIRDSAYE